MSALALITGKLHGEPISRPTRNGGLVTFLKLKVAAGNRLDFWSVATFSDTVREELDGLVEGDALSAAGELHVETYEWNNETRVNLKLTADRVMALKPKAKAKPKTKARASRPEAERLSSDERRPPFDDDLPDWGRES